VTPSLGIRGIKRVIRQSAKATESASQRGADTGELTRRREDLTKAFSDAQWDLGGLVYEMARRDHFRMDVVVRQAAQLQAIDAELGEVERLLRLEEAAAAGSCPSCGALYAHGAVFCWQCGEPLIARTQVEGRIVPQ
jgi:predicted RNA-binding Zn-ribbon protein involved in translation (DUF1610 family)